MEGITGFYDSGLDEARRFSFYGAWNDFLTSPIIGNHFVGSYDNFYPHNIILEVMMSLGVVGLFIFLRIILRVYINFRNVFTGKFNTQTLHLFLFGLCFILISLTSGSIVASPEFWAFFILLSVIQDNKFSYA